MCHPNIIEQSLFEERNIIKNSLTYKENELIKKSSFFLQKILDKIKLISYNTKHALKKRA